MLTDHDSPLADADVRHTKDARINLRVSSRQAQLLRRAAAAEDRSLTEFVLQSAAEQAERVLADRRWFIFSQAEWAAFEAALDQPLPDPESLRSLMLKDLKIDLSDL